LVVNEMEGPATEKSDDHLTSNEQIAMRCLTRALTASGFSSPIGQGPERVVVYAEDWRKVFYAEGKPGQPANTKRMAFSRAMDGLVAKGRVGALEDLVWQTATRTR
jgi:hypothetical protein